MAIFSKIKFLTTLVALLFFCLAFFANQAMSASTDNIQINIEAKESYKVGEKISFSYELSSSIVDAVSFFVQFSCSPNIPQPIPEQIEADLTADKFSGMYEGPIISPQWDSAECQAIVQLTEPYVKKITKDFKIAGNTAVNIRFLICENESCGKELADFSLDAPFYLSYRSTQKFPVQAVIKNEAGEILETIDLPAWHSFIKPGLYTIGFSFQQPGFKPIYEERSAMIQGEEQKVISCNNDNICQEYENPSNCPNDCQPPLQLKNYLWLIPVALGFLILIGVSAFSFFRSRKNKNTAV